MTFTKRDRLLAKTWGVLLDDHVGRESEAASLRAERDVAIDIATKAQEQRIAAIYAMERWRRNLGNHLRPAVR